MADRLQKIDMSMAEVDSFFKLLGLDTGKQRQNTNGNDVVIVPVDEYPAGYQFHFLRASEKVA